MEFKHLVIFLLVTLQVSNIVVCQSESEQGQDYNINIAGRLAHKELGCKAIISQDEGLDNNRFLIPVFRSRADEHLQLRFMLKGKGRISVLLQTSRDELDNNTYIIELSESEAKILKNENGSNKITITHTSVEAEVLISTATPTGFWMKVTDQGNIQVGKLGHEMPFLIGQDLNPLKIKTFSFVAHEDNNATVYYDCDLVACKRTPDCAVGKVCIDGTCKDLCEGTCGNNTVCSVADNVAICRCKDKHIGDPLNGCVADPDKCKRQKDCPSDNICADGVCKNPCDGACGKNTVCNVSNNAAVCVCKDKFIGDPRNGCAPDPDRCKKNKDCLESSVCVDGTCVNVCANACGKHTTCQVQNNVAFCTCLDNYHGNPLQGCDAKKHYRCTTLFRKGDRYFRDLYPIPPSTNSVGEDLLFEFMLMGDATDIRLQTSPKEWDKDAYYIELGVNRNIESVIGRIHDKIREKHASVQTKNILYATEMRGFWIRVTAIGDIQVGKKGETVPFVEWRDPTPLHVKYFSFSAYNVGETVVMSYDCVELLIN